MQTTEFKVPESITVNGMEFKFADSEDVEDVNRYLDMIEKLQAYDSHVVFGKRS